MGIINTKSPKNKIEEYIIEFGKHLFECSENYLKLIQDEVSDWEMVHILSNGSSYFFHSFLNQIASSIEDDQRKQFIEDIKNVIIKNIDRIIH